MTCLKLTPGYYQSIKRTSEELPICFRRIVALLGAASGGALELPAVTWVFVASLSPSNQRALC
jgi:hypothetical protein